ncbi:MAG: GNAT family N-acetyltransferase [Planctomycetota bacterium]
MAAYTASGEQSATGRSGWSQTPFSSAKSSLKTRAWANITVATAQNFEGIGSLRSIWNAMQSTQPSPRPNADIDRYTSVVEATEGRAKPYVMLFRRDHQPTAMVIARVEDHRLSLKLGYKDLLHPRLRCLNVVYGGILGRVEGEVCSVVFDELSRRLKSGEFDAIRFNYLDTGSDFYRAVRETPGFFTRGHFPKIDEHWRMSVPESIDRFYQMRSRKHRGNLRRAVRKFQAEYPGESSFARFSSEGDVDAFVRLAAEISSRTYQSALGAGIVNDEQTRHRIRTAARRGRFDGSLLFAGDKPCAFQLGLRYNQTYYLISVGYDPDLSSYGTGTVLFPAIHTIDFYFGDAGYKRHYGTEHWPEACVYVFAPRRYPMTVNALRCSVAGVNAGLAYIAKKIGGTNRLRRTWRGLLKSTASPSRA